MVRRIRLRGHVIRLYGLSPNSSRSRPRSCPTCSTLYNDGSHRRCYYLCCEFDDCFDCVINKNKFICHKFTELSRLSKIKMEVVQTEEKEDNDGEENPKPGSSSSSSSSSRVIFSEPAGVEITFRMNGVTSASPPAPTLEEKTEGDKNKLTCYGKGGGGGGGDEMVVSIKKEPEDKEKNGDVKIPYVKIMPKRWLPLVILERVEELIKEEPVESMAIEGTEEMVGETGGRGGRRGSGWGQGRGPGRPRIRGPGRPRLSSPDRPGVRGPGRPRLSSPGRPGVRRPGRPRLSSPGRPRLSSPGRPRLSSPGRPRLSSPGRPRIGGPGRPRIRGPGRPRGSGGGSFGRGRRPGPGRPPGGTSRLAAVRRRRRSTRLISSTKNSSQD